MALFTRDNKKVHFVHIPKTMGSSIMNAFKENGWKYESPPGDLWPTGKMEGHPQKRTWEMWEKAKEVDLRFSIVRNPYDRIMSLIRMWIQFEFFDVIATEAEKAIKNNDKNGIFLNKRLIDFSKISFDKTGNQTIERNKNLKSDSYRLHMIYNHVENYIRYKYNIDIFNLSNEDLISFYFEHNLKTIYRDGLNCTPMTEFISRDTKIYKMESDIDALLVDLKNLGYIDQNYLLKSENISSLKIGSKEEIWSEKSDIKTQFYKLYENDFEKFGYKIL